MAKCDAMYWTPVAIAVPDDDREVLLCLKDRDGNMIYDLGKYDVFNDTFTSFMLVNSSDYKVFAWIDYPDYKGHHYRHWLKMRYDPFVTGYKWKESDT